MRFLPCQRQGVVQGKGVDVENETDVFLRRDARRLQFDVLHVRKAMPATGQTAQVLSSSPHNLAGQSAVTMAKSGSPRSRTAASHVRTDVSPLAAKQSGSANPAVVPETIGIDHGKVYVSKQHWGCLGRRLVIWPLCPRARSLRFGIRGGPRVPRGAVRR